MLTTIRHRLALSAAALGLVSLLGVGVANAAPQTRAPQAEKGERDKLCQRLACTAAQKAQIAQIRAIVKPKIKAERAEIRALRQQIAAEYAKDRLDGQRLKSLHGQLDARASAVDAHRRAMRAQVHAVLTPAQRAAFAEREGKRGGGKGKHGGERRGKHRGEGRAMRG